MTDLETHVIGLSGLLTLAFDPSHCRQAQGEGAAR